MILYIDALFKTCGINGNPASDEGAGNLLTADSDIVRNTPPYSIEPIMVGIATADGDFKVFNNDDTGKLIGGVNEYLMSLNGDETYVGWYLDQVLIPVLCANAMKYNVRLPNRLFRKLDDKWSKTAGMSVERAFWQGWYANNKDVYATSELSLNMALNISGMKSLDDIGEDITNSSIKNVSDLMTVLLYSRLVGISKLFSRYQPLYYGE